MINNRNKPNLNYESITAIVDSFFGTIKSAKPEKTIRTRTIRGQKTEPFICYSGFTPDQKIRYRALAEANQTGRY